ncbi:MAG: polysaccharide biosynthesis/export family protein [Planctomycetota bacterium]
MNTKLLLIFTCVTFSLGCAHRPSVSCPDTRIIAINRQHLAAGDLRQNVVVRDGDVIRVSQRPLYEPHELSPLRDSDYRASAYALRPGDIVTVTVFELETPNVDHIQTLRINDAGDLRLYKLGPVQAAGLTRYEFENRIREQLEADGTLHSATVSVLVNSGFGQYTVKGFPSSRSGAHPPGTCHLPRQDTRLLQAIQQFGGFPDSYAYVYLVRPQPEPEFMPLPGAVSDTVIGD